ncbi:substrate-binding periplasmic protein [Marinobacter halodurans]|uniref:substrate-binding periplasmic protein n=1 Tax=Marinobacter halodurans TaxID=2528979 RepID=UPI0013F17188|nr:transporter substrate-binding domain-containing protein [Marinobacter halodurans]
MCAQTVVNYLVVEDKARPFQIVKNGESRGGVVSDIVDRIFAGSDYTVNHLVYPVNRLRHVVSDNEVQHWIAYDALPWRTFGNQGLYVEEPILQTHHVLLTCRQDMDGDIRNVADLQGLSIVTLRNFDYQTLDVAASHGRLRQIPIDRYEAGIKLVSLGRADGFVEMESRLRYHIKSMPEAGAACLRWLDFSAIIPDFPIYLAIDIDWPSDFREFVLKRIVELRQSGELARIKARYLSSDDGLDRGSGAE